MIPLELLAQPSNDSGLVSFCVFAAIVVFLILAKAISSVSPGALAKKIRDMQDAQRGRPVRREPATDLLDLSREPAFPGKSGWSAPLAAIPVGPKKKKKKGAKRSAPVAAGPVAAEQGRMDLRQAVIYAEILALPLALRHRKGGLLRSAPWIR